MNRVILMGNLTRDPALKRLPSNVAVCEFGLAVNRRWRDRDGSPREEVCFVDCSAFGRTAEVINQYMTKGRSILIDGRLKFDQWPTAAGDKRSKLSVIAERFEFIGKGEERQEPAQGPSQARHEPQGQPADYRHPEPANAPADSSIPF